MIVWILRVFNSVFKFYTYKAKQLIAHIDFNYLSNK